VTNSILLTNY